MDGLCVGGGFIGRGMGEGKELGFPKFGFSKIAMFKSAPTISVCICVEYLATSILLIFVSFGENVDRGGEF